MRAVAQRVSRASVSVGGEPRGAIGPGLLIYVGVAPEDGEADADWLAEKIASLRVFPDAEGKMNLSVFQAAAEAGHGPEALAVSQFTLMGDARRGRRPSWAGAAAPEKARGLCERFVASLRALGISCETGEFRASMEVESVNCGPVTILLDSREGAARP